MVFYRKSPRHQLLGRATDGDVSLTILNAQRDDAGVYGCRVEIPGLLNDLKVNTVLIMAEAPVEQPVTPASTVSAGGNKEVLTFAPKHDGRKMDFIQRVGNEKTLEEFFRVENVSRVAAILLFTIIIVLVFVLWVMRLSKGQLQHVKKSTAENIYENIPPP
ncbi:hepatitis A virus cellular receptor 2 homolog [Pholidichthys leucotaenia]